MDYILSTDGQQVVSDDGYIAIKDTKAYEGSCSGEKVVVAGSSSVTPLMEKLKEAYTKRLINKDKVVRIEQGKSQYTAIARGISEDGELIVELEDGTEKKVLSGEVSVRGVYGYV